MTEAFFGFVGIFVGAELQFLLARRAGQEAHYQELKSTAYADYLNSVASVAASSAGDRPKALASVTAAKNRILVYGDIDVVDSMAELQKTSSNLANQDAQNAYKSLVVVMRKQGIASDDVDPSVVGSLLF